MIQKFVDLVMAGKSDLCKRFSYRHPDSYEAIVKAVVALLNPYGVNGEPDCERVHSIDDGEYQGILLFLVAAQGYQPNKYWYVRVDYGSCSGCDTLKGIRGYENSAPTDEQINDYWTLALHIVQELKELS